MREFKLGSIGDCWFNLDTLPLVGLGLGGLGNLWRFQGSLARNLFLVGWEANLVG